MRSILMAICFGALAWPACADPPKPECAVDREALLKLDYMAFDQDFTGGWRPLGKDCKAEAAEVLRAYRIQMMKERPTDQRAIMLFWHEGQMRAMLGQTDEAIALFRQSRQSDDWNLYGDATIAFLQHDRPAVEAARQALLAAPKPEWWDRAMAQAKAEGKPVAVWPANLSVIDAMLRCFDKPYSEAYSAKCLTP
jgi:hypothetical protein